MADISRTDSPRAVNRDLQRERERASFDPRLLTHLLDGGEEETARRKSIEKAIFCEPAIRTDGKYDLDYSECYGAAIARAVKVFELALKNGWDMDDMKLIGKLVRYNIGLSLHAIMFMPALERLSTDEQRDKWLPLAMSFQILGSYSQTEMGHGTFLRNLETTATYDKQTEEFVLNTPLASSMKWWPGALAKSSTHTIVLATLIIDGKNYGMHPFLVQLRSLEDHKPLPGVEVGDIGPKIGLNAADNGYLKLNSVRIPRDQMLMRYAQVSKNGEFTSKGAQKANYGTMILVRANLVSWSYTGLSQAVTIATRYSAVRRQTSLNPSQQESQIIDFQLQQQKLFAQLAAAYALFFVQKTFDEMYQKSYGQIQAGDFSTLPELHCQASCLKARATEMCADGIDVCRRACGGHGYLMASGMIDLYCDHLSALTVEGENTVLYLQTARFLTKSFGSRGKLTGSVAYLNSEPGDCPIRSSAQCRNHVYLVTAYHQRAYRLVHCGISHLQQLADSRVDPYTAWNQSSVYLVNAAKAHAEACMVDEFVSSVRRLSTVAVKPVLTALCSLFAVNGVLQASGEFLSTRALSVQQVELLREEHCRLLAEIRPEAVSLVDAFDYPDDLLQSALGAYDGRVYERIFEQAKQSRINQSEVHPAFTKHMQPYYLKSLL